MSSQYSLIGEAEQFSVLITVSIRILFALILCNLIWSAHPLMGKLAMESLSPAHGAWLRYSSGLVSYLLVIAFLRVSAGRRQVFSSPFMLPRGSRDLGLLCVLGFLTFCFSPLTQMTGLSSSRATDNALIIAMEPLMTVFFGWVFLRERLTRTHWISFTAALLGFALLTGLTPSRLTEGWDSHLTGNLVMLVSLTGEAVYSTLGRKLIDRYPPSGVFGSSLVVGVIFLTLTTALWGGLPSWGELSAMSLRSWGAVLWLGPLGTAFCYFIWMSVLGKAPIPTLALTLFIQPLLGPVWAALFLGDRLSLLQGVGSLLILGAVFGQTWAEIRGKAQVE